jgi:ADP-ribosylglycohydrolase
MPVRQRQEIQALPRGKPVILNYREYYNKVLGCWLGKNIGGTLGAPFEWRRQVNDVAFYTQDLAGEALPNDDLDIQLLWLVALEERGLDLDARTLGEYWVLYVTPHWSEYGTAKVNLRAGLMPPLSGTLHNDYRDSCGSFIRSEIWACIAPGSPQVAARYAYQDAILDHGDGEGVYAELFCAIMESAAFVQSDIEKLIEIGLAYIPADCGVSGAVRDAQASYRAGKSWQQARESVLAGYRGGTFFEWHDRTSEADWQRGFGQGKRGWDAPCNIGMLIIGLLYGEGDFGRSICTTVNCGEDTDCTGATAGALFGILHGAEAIPERWVAPIGRKIRTACLNVGELGYYGDQLPADVDEMTRRTARIARQVILRHDLGIELAEDRPTDLSGLSAPGAQTLALPAALLPDAEVARLLDNLRGPIYRFDFFDIAVDYGEGPLLRDDVAKTIRLRIYNTYKVQASLNIRWYAPEGWQISPAGEGYAFSLPPHLGGPLELAFEIQTGHVAGSLNRAVVEITSDGRPTVMLVPIVLRNGNLIPV